MSKTQSTAAAAVSPDDEIAEIMNEIQSLQESMAQAEDGVGAEARVSTTAELGSDATLEDELSDFRGSGDEPSMEETLASMKDESPETGSSLLDSPPPESDVIATDDEVDSLIEAEMAAEAGRRGSQDFDEVSMPDLDSQQARADGSLTMVLSGKMSLRLKYEFGGQEVTLSFGDDALRVQLADGTEFKVPVGRPKLKIA